MYSYLLEVLLFFYYSNCTLLLVNITFIILYHFLLFLFYYYFFKRRNSYYKSGQNKTHHSLFVQIEHQKQKTNCRVIFLVSNHVIIFEFIAYTFLVNHQNSVIYFTIYGHNYPLHEIYNKLE